MSEKESGEPESKQELRRQMEEARESISGTVAEIKSVVTQQYDEVRETVETARQSFGEVLDWRTEFERNPLVWGAGAVSIGILVGFGIARAFEEEDEGGRGKKPGGKAGHIVAELSGFADVVLPTISSKVKELFGLDLDAYLRAAHEKKKTRAPAKKTPAKKRGTARAKKSRALQSKKSRAHKQLAPAPAAKRGAKKPSKARVKRRASKG